MNMRKERQIDETPILYSVIKLSDHICQQIANHLKVGRVVRVYFGAKTRTSSNPILDAFINGPGNGDDYNMGREKAIPQGANIVHEDSVKFIREQVSAPIKMLKDSKLDKAGKHHCYLVMDTNWDLRN